MWGREFIDSSNEVLCDYAHTYCTPDSQHLLHTRLQHLLHTRLQLCHANEIVTPVVLIRRFTIQFTVNHCTL